MEDRQLSFETDLYGRDTEDWWRYVQDVFEAHGFFEPLGEDHFAGFLEAGNKLLVTFENAEIIRTDNPSAEPRGFGYARYEGWSHLALVSTHESWFRTEEVVAFFDKMIDDDFFDDFESVLFYGGGNGTSYAAAAYSVASPGASVITLRPQATLDPQSASWDTRFTDVRKLNFSDRYGYAPEMIEGADHVFVAYDPFDILDTCHADMFRKPHVELLPCPLMGDDLENTFERMGILDVMLRLAMDRSLDRSRFMQLLRARRYDEPYVRNLVDHLIRNRRKKSARAICAYMMNRGSVSYFQRKLKDLERSR